ncbi:LTA synthase family protein [Marinobacter bohaiensis]|uniref:LTA synthase family protein n=1 Tax=Marinobacter bohaiensis TaxID=2201898 RepID=UPI000DAC843F|nr:LTA synthase family protein [Marinobacter bohaiensis]
MPVSERSGLPRRFYGLIRWSGAYAPLLGLFVLILFIEGLSRMGLTLWQADRVMDTPIGATILLHGLRVDTIVASLAVAVPLLLLPLLGHRHTWTLWKRFTMVWALAMLLVILFMELATPTFIAQYDVRPNRLFVEYLKYPNEVFATLWHGFRIPLIVGLVLCTGLAALCGSLFRPWLAESRAPRYGRTLLAWPFVVLAVFMGIRSTTDHRPANPAMFALTSDALVNSLILNSTWSVAYAVYNLRNEIQADERYVALDSPEAMLDEVRSAPWLANHHFSSTDRPTLHTQEATRQRKKPLNLVIVLEESLGATYVKSLGGQADTPQLERLKQGGWWFENLYATGTRSVRGIEAVISGYLPTPARSVVKLSLAQNHFFTLAGLLQAHDYDTGFIYGGEAHFDNMRSFFTGNGFEHIVDQADYDDPVFTGSWGVSDEDLFNRTHRELKALNKQDKPFFRLVFSSSNHSPFQYPDGRIQLHGTPKNTPANAVRYADYALGQFIEQARESDYWDDTVFLIVADHDDRVWGNELVPIKNFHIPGLILGADIKPRRIQTLASQIDMAPTLLSLIGLDSTHPMIGRDLTRNTDVPGRAMMQFYDYFAWMDSDHNVTILRPDQAPLAGHYDPASGETRYTDAPPAPADVTRARAHAQLPLWLYRQQKYGLPEKAGL